jgi:hypothetical protein
MLIASWPLHDFAGFLQIISWITLPVLFLAVLITMLAHYYQRTKNKKIGKLLQPGQEGSQASAAPSYQQARYRALKKDFEALQDLYHANEDEMSMLNAEMKRQDHVIDQLRGDLVSLEKNLLNLKLALQLKEEQLHSVTQLLDEKAAAGAGIKIPVT